jgi:cytoskeleton protein RodZ
VESFGARLKREREKRKITLDEIALSTKIGTRFLTALEEEQFDQLPGGIFNKGFVKAYARHLGIDEDQAVADYVAANQAIVPEISPEVSPELVVLTSRAKETGDLPEGGIPWGLFAVALLILAFGLAIWGVLSRDKSAKPIPVVPASVDAKSSSPGAESIALARPARAATPERASATPVSPAQPAAHETSPPAASPDAASNPGAFLVQIKAREDSWVAISADGREIMQDTLSASEQKSIGAREEIVIKTGNAGALDISFNGKKLPSQGAYNQVKTLTFDPNGQRP